MKVNIDKTLEVSDEQRKAIARRIDGADAKKRDATRDEMKEFIWSYGAEWENVLAGASPVADADDDVVGGAEYIGNVDVTHAEPEGMDLI